MRFQHILHKILAVCIATIAVFACTPVQVRAAARYEGTHELNLTINEDTSIKVTQKVILQNNSNDIISNYQLSVPFEGMTSISGKRDGSKANLKLRNKNLIDLLMTSSPLTPGQKTTLEFSYLVQDYLESTNGLVSLYLPVLDTAESLKEIKVKIKYPESFPPLAFLGNGEAEVEGTVITVRENKPLKLVWGSQWGINIQDDTVSLVDTASDSNQLVNIVPNLPNQTVRYTDLVDIDLFTQENGNVWASAEDPFSYSAAIDLTLDNADPEKFYSYKYVTYSLPEKLEFEEGLDRREKVKTVYDYLVSKAGFSSNNLESIESLSELSQRVALLDQNKFTSLELAYIMAGYLDSLGLEHQIAYGYFYGVDWPQFNEQVPHAWLEVNLDGEAMILDPYLEKVSELRFFDVLPVGRVKFGVWDPESIDTLLGLGGPGLKMRPEVVELESVLGAEDANLESSILDVVVKAPQSVLTMQPYSVDVSISNGTDKIVALRELWWDEFQITNEFLEYEGQFHKAIAPFSELDLRVSGLTYSQMFRDGVVEHRITLVPESDDLDIALADYQILYVINTRVLLAVVSVLFLLVSGIAYFWWRWEQKQKLVSYLSEDPRAVPVL